MLSRSTVSTKLPERQRADVSLRAKQGKIKTENDVCQMENEERRLENGTYPVMTICTYGRNRRMINHMVKKDKRKISALTKSEYS
jgi:hypothetical protein